MKFGISTWNFLMTYGEQADLPTTVGNIIKENFGLELWLDWHVAPELIERKHWDDLKRMCQNKVGLSLHSKLMSFFDIQILKEEIELCRFLESDVLVVHPRSLGLEVGTLEYSLPFEPSKPDSDRIIKIMEYAEKQGVCLALENGSFRLLKYVRDLIRTQGFERNFGICLDTGHANLYKTQDPPMVEQFFEEFRDDLVHIHISDNLGTTDQHISLGEGNIDWSAIVPRVGSLQLKGQILFELNTPEDPLVSAKNARYFLLNLPQRSQRSQRI